MLSPDASGQAPATTGPLADGGRAEVRAALRQSPSQLLPGAGSPVEALDLALQRRAEPPGEQQIHGQ